MNKTKTPTVDKVTFPLRLYERAAVGAWQCYAVLYKNGMSLFCGDDRAVHVALQAVVADCL